MYHKKSKKKSRVRRIVTIVVAVLVVGVIWPVVSFVINTARHDALLKTVVLHIEPEGKGETQIALDLTKSDEKLMEELSEAIGPVLPGDPIRGDTGRISYRFRANLVTKPTIRYYLSNPKLLFRKRGPNYPRLADLSMIFYIRYEEGYPNPYRLSSKDINRWWLKKSQRGTMYRPTDKWEDHCSIAEYGRFKEMVLKEIIADCKTNVNAFISLYNKRSRDSKSWLEAINE